MVFYKDGVQANDPYKSYLTNEQVIRHDLLAIQSEASCSGLKELPSLAFVGTHLDQGLSTQIMATITGLDPSQYCLSDVVRCVRARTLLERCLSNQGHHGFRAWKVVLWWWCERAKLLSASRADGATV